MKLKKSAQNFFILKHVIKNFKTSQFYYLKMLVQLNLLQRYEGSKFLVFNSKIPVKTETLAFKKLYRLLETDYFWILVFRLKLNISGTLSYNLFGVLFCEKKFGQD